MSAIQYAKRVRCDWPRCEAEAEVTLGSNWPDHTLPEGWTNLQRSFLVTTLDGAGMRELCPVHAMASVASLVDAFVTTKEPAR